MVFQCQRLKSGDVSSVCLRYQTWRLTHKATSKSINE